LRDEIDEENLRHHDSEWHGIGIFPYKIIQLIKGGIKNFEFARANATTSGANQKSSEPRTK